MLIPTVVEVARGVTELLSNEKESQIHGVKPVTRKPGKKKNIQYKDNHRSNLPDKAAISIPTLLSNCSEISIHLWDFTSIQQKGNNRHHRMMVKSCLDASDVSKSNGGSSTCRWHPKGSVEITVNILGCARAGAVSKVVPFTVPLKAF